MKKKYIFRSEFLFFIALAIYMIAKTIEISTIFNDISWMPQLMKVLRYVSYGIIAIKLIYDSIYTEVEIVKILLIFILLGLVSLHIDSNVLFCSFFFIIAARNIDIRKLLMGALWIQLILTIMIAVASQIGLVSDWMYNIEGRNRHSLGYIYPSYIASIFFYMILAYMYIRKEKLHLLETIMIGVLNCIIFVLTDSKTSFVLTFLAIVVFFVLKYYKKELKNNLISKLLYSYSVFGIAIISIVTCIVYNDENNFLVKINSFINNRLIMGHNALMEHGVSLFGEKIRWIGFGGLGYTTSALKEEYNFVDCSYVKVLLDYGIIFFVIMLSGYALVSYRAIKEKDRFLCNCILFMCIYSIIEPRIIEFGFNPFVLSLCVLFRRNTTDTIEENITEMKSDFPIPKFVRGSKFV